MRQTKLIALLLTFSTVFLPVVFEPARAQSSLDMMEVHVFGKKLGGASQEERLGRLERAFGLAANPKLSYNYRLARLISYREKISATQRRNLAILAYNRGFDEMGKGHNENAILSYRQAIQFDPSLIQAYNNLGNLLMQKNSYDETVQLYKKGIQIMPNEPLLHRNLGVLYEKLGKIQEAVAEYQIYLKNTKEPDPPIKAIVENFRDNRTTSALPDYLSATTHSSSGRQLIWPEKLNPVKVHVQITDPKQNFVLPLIQQSLREWERATEGRLRFEMTTSAEQSNILIMLREAPLSHPVADIGHTEYLMPTSQFRRQQLSFVTITLSTGDPKTEKDLPMQNRDEQVYRLALHEVGHAVGIWGHSSNPSDIMFTHPVASKLSSRDVRTVRLMYGLEKTADSSNGEPQALR